MVKAFILDDQDINIQLLKVQLGRYFPGIELSGFSTVPEVALQQIHTNMPDLLFLDIRMPGIDGFDFLEQIRDISPEVIFVTAYNDFALKAFSVQAAGYITKPVETEQLILTVNRTIERIQQRKTLALLEQKLPAGADAEARKLSLPMQKGLVFFEPEEIFYCESSGNYTNFFLRNEKQVLASKQIGHFEQMLPARHFVRIHDRYIVNVKYVKAYIRGNGGMVVLENGQELPVSVRRKQYLLRYLG